MGLWALLLMFGPMLGYWGARSLNATQVGCYLIFRIFDVVVRVSMFFAADDERRASGPSCLLYAKFGLLGKYTVLEYAAKYRHRIADEPMEHARRGGKHMARFSIEVPSLIMHTYLDYAPRTMMLRREKFRTRTRCRL